MTISLALAGLALMAGILLVPGKAELALIDYKDRRFQLAFDQYQAMWDAGNESVSVLIPLRNLYLQEGNVDGAVELMEQYVADHPDSLEAITTRCGNVPLHSSLSKPLSTKREARFGDA